MNRVIQIPNQNGETVSVIPKDFEIGHEAWNEYKLLDGGKVRVKVTVYCASTTKPTTPAPRCTTPTAPRLSLSIKGWTWWRMSDPTGS